MKTKFVMAAIAAMSLTLTSCGLGTVGNINPLTPAPTDASSALLSSTGQGLLGTVLSSLLGNQTSQASLVGTWTYNRPKVVFESNNVLANLGGQVVSNNLEQKLGTQFGKLGFAAGTSTLTFNSDNSCILTVGGKATPGTYSFDPSTSRMTITGALGVASINCTVTVNGGELYLLFEADKLMTVAKSIKASSVSSLTSLLQNYSGLKLGWCMTK